MLKKDWNWEGSNKVTHKSIAVNYLLNTAYQILVIIVPIITTPYISRTLGAEGIGIYSYTYSIMSYFMIVALMGTSTYGQRTIAYYQDDKYKRSCKFFEILIFRFLTTIICCVAYYVYLVSSLCKYRNIALIQIIYLIAIMFDVSWLFQGLEDFKLILLRNAAVKILNVVLIFMFVNDSSDVAKYTTILAVMTLIANISIWPYIPQIIQKVCISDVRPFQGTKEIFLLFLPTIAVQVNAVLDKTMIGGFAVSSAENGYYEQTEKVVRIALAVVTSLGTVMIPRIAKLYHDRNTIQMEKYIEKSYQFVWTIGIPIMFGIMAISRVFVPVFFGEGYDRVKILMPIYSLSIIAVALSNVTGCQFLIPTKKQNIYTLAVVLSTVVNVILNIFLIPRYLSIGAAVASVIAECVGSIFMLFYVGNKRLIKIFSILKVSIKKWIAAFVMFMLVLLMTYVCGASLFSLIVTILGGMLIYCIMLLILKDEFFYSILKTVVERIGSMRKSL